jgi:hypothetical protein
MDLQNAQARSFAKYAGPGGGVEFVATLVERDRIGTIRTPQRTAMRQFGEQAEGRRGWGWRQQG